MSLETMPAVLFPKPPVIRFAPEQDTCTCDGQLLVKKTRKKTVLTMAGPIIAHEIIRKCTLCSQTIFSDALPRLVQSRCNVAYDIMVHVGKALFQRYRNIKEIRLELLARNVRICESEIGYLGRKFIMLLAIAHRQATPQIRLAMNMAGGYVLHLDAIHDGGAPALMTGLDGLSKIVLANVKLPSEDSADIADFLRKIKAAYGTPRACVHDMGVGICKAVAEVFPGTPSTL